MSFDVNPNGPSPAYNSYSHSVSTINPKPDEGSFTKVAFSKISNALKGSDSAHMQRSMEQIIPSNLESPSTSPSSTSTSSDQNMGYIVGGSFLALIVIAAVVVTVLIMKQKRPEPKKESSTV